jgi:hypothetical protein
VASKRKLDPVNGNLLERLEYHYRKNCPLLTKQLEANGTFKEFLSRKAAEYREIVARQVEKGLAFYQAEELAEDATFARESPPREEPEEE